MAMNNNEDAVVAALTATTSEPKSNAQTQDNQQGKCSSKLPEIEFPYYTSIKDTQPHSKVTLAGLIEKVKNPSIGDKQNAAALTPYSANGKQKQDAIKAPYHAIIVDHDDDDLTKEQVCAKYDQFNVNYVAFSTSSHLHEKDGKTANRWKVVIPLAAPINQEIFSTVSLGVTLFMEADLAQVRVQQVFYAPNKLSEQAPYDYIMRLDSTWLNISDRNSELVKAALQAFQKYERSKDVEAKTSKAKPRNVIKSHSSIIVLVNDAYDLESVILAAGYKKQGKKYLSPFSESGLAGVYIFNGEKLYSHHGESDPLSSLNHNGHALDTFDVLRCLHHSGDFSAAIKHYANELDGDGQKQRQKEYAEAKEEVKAPPALTDISQALCVKIPDDPKELLDLPYNLGELQRYVYCRMSYPSRSIASITALSILTYFVQKEVTIDSRDGLGFNEYYMVLAKTGFGKEDLRKSLIDLSKAVYLKDHKSMDWDSLNTKLHFSAGSSRQAIHQAIEDNNSAFFLADEFAEWLKDTKQTSNKQQALGYLMEAYSKATSVIDPGRAVTTKYTPVENPRLSILATSTAEAMTESFNREQADSGAYNRWVILAGDDALPEKVYEGLQYTPDDELIDFLSWANELKDIKISMNNCFKDYIEFDKKYAEPIKRKDHQLGGRLGEQSIKIAGLIALSDKRLELKRSDLETAFKIRCGIYEKTRVLFDTESNLKGQHSTMRALEQLISLFKSNQEISISQLRTRSRQFGKLSVQEQAGVKRMLIEEGYAIQHPTKQVYVSQVCAKKT